MAARKQQGIMTNSWSTLAFFKSPTLANAATAVPAGRSQLMRDILETGDVSLIFRLPYDRDDIFARAFDMSAADCVVKPFSPRDRRRGSVDYVLFDSNGDVAVLIEVHNACARRRHDRIRLWEHTRGMAHGAGGPVAGRMVCDRDGTADLLVPIANALGIGLYVGPTPALDLIKDDLLATILH